MDFKRPKRLDVFKTGIFEALDNKKQELIRQGRTVYNFSIGTPDFPVPENIKKAFIEAAADPKSWTYAIVDTDELLETVVWYYKDRFGVDIEKDEVISVHGTQEGMGHLGLALADPGDKVLLPNPGYPIFEAGSLLAQTDIVYYPLVRENDFLPRLDMIDPQVLSQVRYMVVSYPSNPVGAVASKEVYLELIEYAKKYGFIIINDNAYSDIAYDGFETFSFLSLPGAKEVGVEFLSLSKSYNVTGMRISFLAGNRQIVDSLRLLRSQIDFGMPYPTQRAAIEAMKSPRDGVERQRLEYQRRRDAMCGGFRRIGWDVPDGKGTMFVWAPLPEKFSSSVEFVTELMEKTGVIATPGISFGPLGEGYVRFALVHTVETIGKVIELIDSSGILR
ncbi:MAG: aminotransferase class I/II-fold pyridoxal phosphate-dependent enzyme [Oscillospiraceae bacterium]|nr:aminotransferase class I/II-fold pyridoxal phosphate-dependent enzyme [Oscillospiraceae bacterium]